MGDAEQPGAHGRRSLQGLQRHEGARQAVLDDILAIHDRAGQSGAIAVQLRPQIADQREEFGLIDAAAWPFLAQAGFPSSTVIPKSPLSPKAIAVSYSGSLSI